MDVYSADRSLKGKLRRRLAKLFLRRKAQNRISTPLITISFDDAPQSAALIGAEILKRHGLKATYFISGGLMGKDSPSGLCAHEDEIRALDQAGHEIACHTYSHLDCGKASGAHIDQDLQKNNAVFSAMGIRPETFAFPYGDVSLQAKFITLNHFKLSRALHKGLVIKGSDLNQAPAVGIEDANGLSEALKWMDEAIKQPSWLILYTHDVCDNPSAFGCTPETLETIILAAKAKGFRFVTCAEGADLLGA